MDGKMAVLFAAVSAFQGINHPESDDYWSKKEKPSHLSFSVGQASVNDSPKTTELGLNYHFSYQYGPWQPVLSSSVTEKGAAWIGLGAAVTLKKENFYFTSFFIPGLYHQGGGIDLGSVLEFKSGIEAGYQLNQSTQLSIGYDHRSNADIGRTNPGMESVYFRYHLML